MDMGKGDERSSKLRPGHNHTDVVTVTPTMLDLERKELAENIQKEMALQREAMKDMEEKFNAILVKVPVLESRTEDVQALRRELEIEREQRMDSEKNFMECIDKLMHEIVEANLKALILEERIEKLEAREQASCPLAAASSADEKEPSSSSSSSQECSKDAAGLINDLSKDIQAKFREFGEAQENLRIEMETTRKDLMKSLNYSIAPPIKDILGEQSPSTSVEPNLGYSASTSMPDHSNNSLPTSTSTFTIPTIDNNPAHGFIKKTVDARGKAKFHCKCSSRFSSRYNLESHIHLISSAGRRFLCPVCSKRYPAVGTLRHHMKTKHKVDYLKGKKCCSRCGQLFGSLSQLQAHHSVSHAENASPE